MNFKLICFDLDGVIFQTRNFWLELHKAWGTLEQGKELTEKYLHTDYDALVKAVVLGLWQGKDQKSFKELIESLKYNPGVHETLEEVKKKGLRTAIITSSDVEVARKVQKDLGIDFIFANELHFKDGKVAGPGSWPIAAGTQEKAMVLKKLCAQLSITPQETIFVGDSHADLGAFKIAGNAIAFNSKDSELKKIANHIVDEQDLRAILHLF